MSTTGKEYKLAIRIAGIIDKSFNVSLASVNRSLKKTIAAMDADFTRLDKGFNKIARVGKNAFNIMATAAGVATAAIGAATGAAIKVGSEFESAFAGVKKTVDATEAGYEKLRQDILETSSTMPSSAVEIAGVMEIAGQLGIANKSLTDFTETMINMGVSTNLSAEEAATALAKFANITNMADYDSKGISNFERLGSTVVDLGNNFATTEADIVALSTHLAAAGSLAGLSEEQILGIAAAMSSVGIAAESGGSSMSTTLMNMQQAVAEGKEGLATYAKTAGMTAQEFATLFREDAGEALNSFIEGIGESGEGAYAILKDLGLSTIRVRKTILGLAGAEGLLEESMTMANEAWEENTALAIEAGKRYETADSQMQIMKNAFTELGIVAYEDLRGPFVDVLGDITEGVTELTDYVGGADGLSKWIDNIGTSLPTLQRKFKKFGEPVFNGIVGGGKWIVKHGNGLISVLVGIGSAMATYKIASTLVHVVNAIMTLGSMNPATLGILGIVTAVGALGTALAAYKQHEQDLIDANLAEHFGTIELTMEELQAVAEHIISSDSLGGVKRALEAFEDLDGIAATMESSISEINKMNWKVSIGMELTPDEQENYKAAIDEYVTAAQEYALQSQYSVSINLAEAGLEDSNVVEKVTQFYADKYDELAALGKQLNDAVTDAFNDGLLDIKETQVIAEIQAQMAAIEEALATGEFDAQLSILGMEYAGGGNLSPDSFQNLQAELEKQVAEATAAYKESYAKNYAAIQATYAAGGYLTQEEYLTAISDIQEEYLRNISEVQFKSVNFQIETIMQQYKDELDPAISTYITEVNEVLASYADLGEWDWMDRQGVLWTGLYKEVEKLTEKGKLGDTEKKAISQLLEGMAPTMEEMETILKQYEELGMEIPKSILEGMSSYNMLNALTNNDFEAINNVIGEQIVEGDFSEFYMNLIPKLVEEFGTIEPYIAEGVAKATAKVAAVEIEEAAQTAVDPAVDGLHVYSQNALDEMFRSGFDVDTDVRINLNPTFNGFANGDIHMSIPGINNRAKGGLATRPELTWFAEEGPEMAIPIDGSQNAISLWEQTGRLLGMDSAFDGLDLGSSSSSRIEYNPTLQFYGEAPSKDDLTDALRISQDEFERLMDKYQKTHGRVAFG